MPSSKPGNGNARVAHDLGWRVMMGWPAKPSPDECAPFYRPYVEAAAARGDSLGVVLGEDTDEWRRLIASVPPEREYYRYAPGKWTLGDVMGHVTDAERMFAARALAFARNDPGPYPSFDENSYAKHSNADLRSLDSLGKEFDVVRQSTIALFDNFAIDVWKRTGVASDCEFTVRALGWIIAGHSIHHRQVLTERYL